MPTPAIDEQIKKENHIVAGWLLFYHDRKQEYSARREDILYSSGRCLSSNMVSGGTNIANDTTGRKGQKLADLEKTERWLALVEDVQRNLPADLQAFLRLRREYRYCRGRKGWTTAVQWRLQEMGIKIESRQTLNTWWNRVIDYSARLAAKKNLL